MKCETKKILVAFLGAMVGSAVGSIFGVLSLQLTIEQWKGVLIGGTILIIGIGLAAFMIYGKEK